VRGVAAHGLAMGYEWGPMEPDASPPPADGRRERALRILFRAACVLLGAWCTGALRFGIGGTAGAVVAALFAAGFAAAWWSTGGIARRRVALAFLWTGGAVLGAWAFVLPSADRPWAFDVARLARAEFDGDRVTLRGFRRARWETPERAVLTFSDETLDLGDLVSVDFMVEPFSSFEGAAHTLLTFGFRDGRRVAISAELRKERGEHFDPLAACFRRYELCYVVGDEQDLIHLRTNVRKDRVYLYPVRATPEQRGRLFTGMLRRANDLRTTPEFYNTLTNTCTTSIVRHVEELAPGTVPLSWRVLLPGYADELAYDLGLLDTDLPFAEAKRRFRVDEIARGGGNGPDFSVRIRAGR